jgi:3-oxoacyl-[acyl-carrier-protein] synthase II
MPERVMITGVGVVTPIGSGTRAFTEALRAARSGVRHIRAFDAAGFETRIAAEVEASLADLGTFVTPRKATKLMSRATLFAVAAARMARDHAALGQEDVNPSRLGVSLGAGGMGLVDLDALALQANASVRASANSSSTHYDPSAFARAYREIANPVSALRGLPNLAASQVAIQNQARGRNNTVATACTAGTQAIGDALRMIQCGDADVVLAGGTDAMVNPVGLLGFGMLGTLSRRNEAPEQASRPFDRRRDGFVIGEGAAIVVLEREEFARSRGATLLAELAGYGATCDAYRITDERPDAAGAVAAIRACLHGAEASTGDVDYINAHGTGTAMNDKIETAAIKEVMGSRAFDVPVSSTKSMIGHLVAAAGAVELAACVVALTGGFLPPTINYEEPDPECDLDYVANRARVARIDTALTQSIGFGGQNACLMIRRC